MDALGNNLAGIITIIIIIVAIAASWAIGRALNERKNDESDQ